MRRLTLILLLLSCEAPAAYRLYRLKVTYAVPGEPARRTAIVESPLDPNQWAAYHNDYVDARVELVEHWYCPGDTSRHHPCPKPEASDRTPAMTYPERTRLKANAPIPSVAAPAREQR